ncbi:MAG: N-acetyltransferase family protein [Gammaproteobacteria bacterium]|nr:MAG: N-acetyltransferase family protein [Gammaproteobacteria bacterium]
MDLRHARSADLGRLTEIYNHYVRSSHATFDVEPFSVTERADWFARFDRARYQCWVAELDNQIAGYACSTPFKQKAAYQTSVELSIYLAEDSHARGIGRALYENLLGQLREQDLHRAYAGVAQPNEASMRLHRSFGFTPAAHYSEVGRKFGRYWDVTWLELPLG